MVGNSIPNGTYYPDPTNVGTAPASSYGITSVIGSSQFTPADRGALLRRFWMAPGSGTVSIVKHDGSKTLMTFGAAAFASTPVSFGPDGFLIEAGFRVVVTGSLDWTISYEVA